MRPLLKQDARTERHTTPSTKTETEAEALLQEITEDARKLESRYAKDTSVPEGGE